MIRINLIADRRKTARIQRPSSGRFGIDMESIATIALVAIVLLSAVGYGGYWFLLSRDIADGKADINTAEASVAELQSIIDQVERYTTRKTDLKHRIDVISDLRDNQRGPVRILDEVSRGLPDLLWLDELRVTARAVTVVGRSFTTNSVATFIENLDAVEEFQEPVLKKTTLSGRVYSFEVLFNYKAVPIRRSVADVDATPAR